MLITQNTMANSDQIDNIFMEAETLKALNHPNIVKIINFFVIKKTLQTFFIMEYLDGTFCYDSTYYLLYIQSDIQQT